MMRAGILRPRGAGHAELNPLKGKVTVVVILPAYLHSCGGILILLFSSLDPVGLWPCQRPIIEGAAAAMMPVFRILPDYWLW